MEKTKGINFYDCTVGIWGEKNFMSDVLEGGPILQSCGGQVLTQNDSSLVLPIIREVLKIFGGAMAPPMHKVAPPL